MDLVGGYIITTDQNIISAITANKIRTIIANYFTNVIMKWVSNFDRPIQRKYGNFIERNKGRFEISLPSVIEKQIWDLLKQNSKFIQVNDEIKAIIKNNYPEENVVEELCILPAEGNVSIGNWHRDVSLLSDDIWLNKTYYITQVIYLDDLSDTEFCLDSQNESNHEKRIFKSKVGCSVSFDGRMLHRGLENKSDMTRYAIYISYHKSSYVDEESVLEYAQIPS